MKLWKYLKNHLKRIEKKALISLSFISLTLTYILGIGLTSLVAKLVQKNFFLRPKPNSQWSKSNYTDKVNKGMY
jgi:hypothetical protein